MNKTTGTIIELTVRNHPGVMAHITGLFSRRSFNMEAILCGPIGATKSRMYILVKRNGRLKQIIKQLQKLYDVLSVSLREDSDRILFNRFYGFIKDGE